VRVRVLLLSAMLLGVAACTSPGVPGANADLTPPAFAERPPPAPPPDMGAAAASPVAPAPAPTAFVQASNEPGAPVPLTPSVGASPSAELSIPGRPAPPPPPEAAAPPPAPPPPPEATAAAAPPPAAAASGFAFPLPAWPFFVSNQPVPGQLPGPRLTLSNFSYDRAHVEATITANPDCGADTVSQVEFDLAYNGTRVIQPPTGDDVCWRRDVPTDGAAGPQWSRWNRAFLSAGQSVDSRL
jgi:hypothetical protein